MRSVLAIFGAAGLLFVAASCGTSSNNTNNTGGSSFTPTGGSGGRSAGGSGGLATNSGGKAGGGPVCTGVQVACSSVCIDPTTDNKNCGACNKQCGMGESCSGGSCQCTGGLSACTSGCVNLMSDGANCGVCGMACASGSVCSQGKCTSMCATGETQCGQSCPNTMTDSRNCGFCNNACQGGQACTSGSCGCATGQTTCNGVCADLMTNNANCGTCGHMCTGDQSCSAGQCAAGTGAGGMSSTGGSGGSAGMSVGGSAGMSSGGMGTGGSGDTMVQRGTCNILKAGMIADFEEGMGMPVVPMQEGRTGQFEIFNDATSGATETMTVESSGGTDMCDQWALHVKGTGFTDWGAGTGLSLVGAPTSPTPYNAQMHGFTGISFKAKLGTTADSKSPVRFNISTPWTEDKSNPGGQCDTSTLAATTTKAARDCYQHAGKFLPPGSNPGQLTQSWQTFTYCFDRDLYPLSLPSNLTTDQRNNIGTNILKIQWQFNNGKDYSGAYTTDYPKFMPNLPFDLWLDDITFFSGDCPNMVTSPSNGSPAKAFPQNASMVGSCPVATNAKVFAADIATAYATWTKNFVQSGGKIVAPEQSGHVTSEAIGYGMLIAAAMGDKNAFDAFWGYAKSNGASGGLMNWEDGGSGSATDADLDQAYALLMAAAQWPSGGYDGNSLGSRIASADVSGGTLTGGSQFSSANYNPSYFAPAAMRKLSALSGFVNQNYTLVNNNIKASTAGVPTDWADKSSGAPSGPGGAQVTSDIQDGNNGAMGYDAARVPFRLALDACLNSGDTSGLSAIVTYFAGKYDSGASIDLMKAGWYKKTDGPFSTAKDIQGSFIGPMGAAGMAMKNQAMLDRAFRTILDILESGDFNHTYFPSTVGLLTLLMMSGNYPAP
ncbi:MAG TPA: glycosyl hydrolase family 8 [Polyangiaceae bacterium]|nr:glycosyl hydrolase family 8 [Polyangiaceae bacterium]